MILCDSSIFLFLEKCTLSRESYAFSKVTAENHMGCDITAAICKMKEKVLSIDFIEIFQSKMKRIHVKKGFI